MGGGTSNRGGRGREGGLRRLPRGAPLGLPSNSFSHECRVARICARSEQAILQVAGGPSSREGKGVLASRGEEPFRSRAWRENVSYRPCHVTVLWEA
jgi:hypothetical protein